MNGYGVNDRSYQTDPETSIVRAGFDWRPHSFDRWWRWFNRRRRRWDSWTRELVAAGWADFDLIWRQDSVALGAAFGGAFHSRT